MGTDSRLRGQLEASCGGPGGGGDSSRGVFWGGGGGGGGRPYCSVLRCGGGGKGQQRSNLVPRFLAQACLRRRRSGLAVPVLGSDVDAMSLFRSRSGVHIRGPGRRYRFESH